MSESLQNALVRELKEITWPHLEYTEEVDPKTGERRMRIVGIVQEADSVNQNKRVYSREILDEAVAALNDKVNSGRVFGEVDHPDVHGRLKETSHLVTNLWWGKDQTSANHLFGEMLILNTPSGLILKEIVKAGGRPGFSTRGLGKATRVKVDGTGEVDKIDKGFRLESIDFVIDPSVQSAKIQQIIESAEDGGTKENVMENLTIDVLKEKRPDLVEVILAEAKAAFETEKTALTEQLVGQTTKVAEQTARISDLEKEMNGKDGEIEKHLSTLESIVETLKVGGYLIIPPRDGEEEAETKADEGAINAKVEELQATITDLTAKLTEKEGIIQKAEADKTKAEIDKHLLEVTRNLPFGEMIRKRVEGKPLRTIEEVDKAVEDDKLFVQTVLSEEGAVLKGKGREKKVDEQSPRVEMEKEVQERLKARAGMKPTKEAK